MALCDVVTLSRAFHTVEIVPEDADADEAIAVIPHAKMKAPCNIAKLGTMKPTNRGAMICFISCILVSF